MYNLHEGTGSEKNPILMPMTPTQNCGIDNKDPLVAFGCCWLGCCLFDTIPISILKFQRLYIY